MYSAKVENSRGEVLELTNNPNYSVEISGLNPANANIVTASLANQDGEVFKSSKKQKKNIVITIFVKEPVEENRIKLYRYFNTGSKIRLFFKNNSRNVYIDGYVEAFNLEHFSKTQTGQISIICPEPNFIDMTTNERFNSSEKAEFYMPFNSKILRSEGIDSLDFGSEGKGFVDFVAIPEEAQTGVPTPENPIYFNGMGNDFSIPINIDETQINIPLAELEAGMNFIKGGLTLIDPKNYLLSRVFIDHATRILTDEEDRKLYE